MNPNNPLTLKRSTAVTLAVFVAVSCLLGGATSNAATTPTRQTKKKTTSTSKPGAKPAAHRTSALTKWKHSTRTVKGSKRHLPHSSRARLAQLHLDPQRVTEIQQALIREGALNGPPTGAWDDGTREGMRRYQSTNGFATTGLPDAKSLMKLGLGPHPLPEDVQASVAAQQTRNDSLTKPNPN